MGLTDLSGRHGADMPIAVNVLTPDSGLDAAAPDVRQVADGGDGGHVPPCVTAPNGVPALKSIHTLYVLADMVTLCLLDLDFFRQALELRYEPAFYAGHIQGFYLMKVFEALGKADSTADLTELVGLALEKFARGKDPDTSDKQTKHTYTERPQDGWGDRQSIQAFINRGRRSIDTHFHEWIQSQHPRTKQALWIGYEHASKGESLSTK